MGIDIGGATIIQNAGGLTLNKTLAFNAAGQGSANTKIGYTGWKQGGTTYYAAPTGWEINASQWQSSDMGTGFGVFTCPVDGLYAIGYNGIHKGGGGIPTGLNTYGYSAFTKNGVMTYWVHWNQTTGAGSTAWNTGGCSALFQCAANDTLALFINRSPTSTAPDAQSQNFGMYPDAHSAIWCKLVG